MKLLLTIILLFAGYFCLAQKKIIGTSFLKNNGTYVTVRDSADYYRVVTEPDSGSVLFNVAEYYKNGAKRLIGKSQNSEHPLFEGLCETFYKSGVRYCMCTYRDGARVGDEYFFFPNGNTYMVLTFPDDNNRYNEGKDVSLIKANYDSLGTVLVENGNGYCKKLNESLKEVEEEGNVKNGKHDGLWKGYYKKTKLGFTENYKDGELISGTATFDDGSRAT
jgi:antitoxin component YwqK of YwqJK toxin-antitoxin module